MNKTKDCLSIIVKIGSIIFVAFISSCDHHIEKSKELEYLNGTWVMDSATYNRGKKYQKLEACQYLAFLNDSDYTYQTACGCIHDDIKGKYFILNNPNRGLKTITLVPDLIIAEGDTIRTNYDNFDIVNLDKGRLQIVRETEFFNEGNVHLPFSEREIYKKIK